MSDVFEVAPPALVAQCEEINKQWLNATDTISQPYLSHTGCGDDWKIQLVKRHSKDIVMQHLDPTAADGHTYYLFIERLRRERDNCLEEGRMLALAQITNNLSESIGIKSQVFKEFYNPHRG